MAETKKTHTDRKAMRAFVEKVVIDAGVGRLGQQPNFEEKILPQVLRDIAAVTGQQPQLRKAKESIAGFKVREGQIVGLRVTLRREKAVHFFGRLITKLELFPFEIALAIYFCGGGLATLQPIIDE